MVDFNENIHSNIKKNHEGTIVCELSALEMLFSKVLGSFFGESTNYEKRDFFSEIEKLQEIMEQIPLSQKEYALKIAELGRRSNMISYPLNIIAVASHMDRYKGYNFTNVDGSNKLGEYIDKVVCRTDDIIDILELHYKVYGGKIPKQLKKGLKNKIETFDKFKLSKGLNKRKEVSLSDAIKLLHPKAPNEEMSVFYKDIIEGNINMSYGKNHLVSELSKTSKTKDASKNIDISDSIFTSNIQVIIKNLMSLINRGVFDDIEVLNYVVTSLRNKEVILNSKLLPFRFYSAYNVLEKLSDDIPVKNILQSAISDAMDLSIDNISNIEGITSILIDRSGSMLKSISKHSKITAEDISLILGIIAYKKSNADLFMFGKKCIRISLSKKMSVLEMITKLKSIWVGGGTDINLAFEEIKNYALTNDIAYDNLILLTDGDCYGYQFGEFKFIHNGYGFYKKENKYFENPDEHIDYILESGIIKKVWLNNLLGNDFTLINTKNNTKNIVVGFSANFIDIINVYNILGQGEDICKIIDILLEIES